MLCDKCKKNEATIHLNEIHNGISKKMNLCDSCAKLLDENAPMVMNLAEMLFNMSKKSQSINGTSVTNTNSILECPNCGWTSENIKNGSSLFGCAECYNTFATILENSLKSIHRGAVHMGKHPKMFSNKNNELKKLQDEIQELSSKLDVAVKNEAYEEAAVYRDRINNFKNILGELENE